MSLKDDWKILFNAYLGMAEMLHPGPWRMFDLDVRKYLTTHDHLIGSDEHECEVCGGRNIDRDGSNRRFFWGHSGRWFCEAHFKEFEKTFLPEPPKPIVHR